MANPFNTIFRPLVRGFGEAASKAKPFYSGVDQAISAITQNKGTGQQMLAEILKTKGAAKELKDRPVVRAALNQPKITKEQLQKIATDKPAPQFTETTLGKEGLATKFEQWTLPGGENYREILFQLPDNRAAPNAKYDDIAAKARAESRQMTTEEMAERSRLYDEIKRPLNFEDPHYSEPNILAHARVSDRFEPNGDKALHVEEVQSAWHQKARDIRKKEIKRLIDSGVSKAEANKQVPVEYGYGPRIEKTVEAYYETKSGQRIPIGFGKTKEEAEASIDVGWKNLVDIKYETFDKKVGEGVPDSPFKENWHELVMKRLLDDAVKNGYKKVYITPGAEQAKRYNLAKYISKIEYEPTEQAGRYEIVAYGKKGEVVYHEDMVNLRRIEELVGKDMARKIENDEGTLSSPNSGYRDWREFSGLELKSGGEGMLGFYDKMVPSFVNDYGAPYNMRMNLHDTQVGGNKYTVFEDSNPSPFSVVREGGSAIASRHNTREEAEAAAAELSTQPLHSITITPEFEKHVQEKGQRLYQAIPAGIGIGAEALTEEEPAPMKKGGPVSLDAMRLAVMNKKVQHKLDGGALKSGLSRIRKNMNPVRGNTIIKEGGGNWIGGEVERGLKGLKRNEIPVLPITEAEVTAMRNAGYTVYDPVSQTYTKPNPTNQFVDKQITKYIKNQMGTKDDPIRLAADAFPAQKAKLLAEKQVQIDKATADMEKARQLRGYTPEMMTESQKIIRKLEKEAALIERREGLHFKPFEVHMPPTHLPEMRRKAGMPPENLGQTENAKNWENLADRNIESSTARSWTEGSLYPEPLQSNPWLHKVDPESKVYTGRDLERGLGFDHMMDELRNATTPTSGLPKELLIDPKNLSKWTIPQAAEHVDKINAWRAAQKAEADLVRANNAATVLHKDYPEKGMKWVELKTPEATLPEGYKILPDVSNIWSGNEMFTMFDDQGKAVSTGATEAEAMRLYNRQGREGTLADALKYEGETMGHCVVGYCPDVISGKRRIFSLRDAKGNPHATVEVKPDTMLHPDLRALNDERIIDPSKLSPEEFATLYADMRKRGLASRALGDQASVIRSGLVAHPDYPNWISPKINFSAPREFINQIKGMNNRIPKEEYLPYVQDFVRSGKWSDVGDLQNTGLYKTDHDTAYSHNILPELGENGAYGRARVAGDIQPYMTKVEIEAAMKKHAQDDNILPPSKPMTEADITGPWEPEEGMKRGGVVHMDKGGTPENIFGVAETPEQEFQRYLRMLRINASGGKDKFGADIGGRFGINIPVSKNIAIEPYVQGYVYKPNSGKVERGGIAGANLNIRFNNGGAVSDDAMRMAVMNKQLRKHHG